MWAFSKKYLLIVSCVILLLGFAVAGMLSKNTTHAESVEHNYTMKLLSVRYYSDVDRIIIRGVTNLPQATTIEVKLKDKDSANYLERKVYVQNGTFFLMLDGTDDSYKNNNFIKNGDYEVLGNANDTKMDLKNIVLGEIFIPDAH